MPRKKRTWYPGAIYHVMSRGNRRVSLYKEEDDYLSFIEGVKKARLLYPFRIHSMCMMTNHFHMLLETENIELWKIMNRILHPYAMNFNRKYHYTGHLFEDRYTACLIEDEKYLLEVSRYIHLNPVKAQMVREPIAYEYTSYGKFVTPVLGDKEGYSTKKVTAMINELVETDKVLGTFRHTPREQYRMFVEGKISHAEQEMLIQKDMKEDDMWLPW